MFKKLLAIGEWARHRENMLCLVCLVGGITIGFSIVFFCVWLISYICNGLGYTKFELNSVWQGLGALGVFLVALFGLISTSKGLENIKLENEKVELERYKTDSELNSPKGERPRSNI